MDLSKIEGLTEEQSAAITAMYNTDTEGLRNKNEQLLGEKKSIQGTVAEQAQIAEDARQAAVKAEESRLKATNDMDGLKSHYETQLAEQTATANEAAETAKNALLSRDKGTVLSQALGLIHDDYKALAEAKLASMLDIQYNSEQQPVTTFVNDGKVVANNVEEFKGWASEQPQFKKILNGVNSSGADTIQSRASGSNDSNTTESKLAQRLKQHGL
jgi:hypothetical protein